MKVFNPLNAIQSGIIELLATNTQLTIQDVHCILQKDKVTQVSLPNLYRIINQMIEVQMIVKEHSKLSLSRAWIPHLISLANKIKHHYSDNKSISFPLKDGERQVFTADCLANLDPIWFHILASCSDFDKEKQWYAYNSHPWHVIGMASTEIRGYKRLVENGVTCNMIYGNDTFLDLYGKQLVNIDNFTITINKNISLLKEGYALWICGEYIVESIFPEVISNQFSYFFEHTNSMKGFNIELFTNIFTMKAQCSLTLRRSKQESLKLRAILQESICE